MNKEPLTEVKIGSDIILGNIAPAEIGFTCQICLGTQSLPYGYPPNLLPICDTCKAAVRELILKQLNGII